MLLMLGAPFVFVSEIQALCALLDLQLDTCGKALTLLVGCLISIFIWIPRHG